jgi:hypothetical protein
LILGRLADLQSVKTANSESFVYTPPDAAFGAMRILVKPNLGYQAKPPAVVSTPILASVLRGLRRAAPSARILIVEGVTGDIDVHETFAYHGLPDILDAEMRLAGIDELFMQEFPNINPNPVKYDKMTAPSYIEEFDCTISIGAFKRTTLHDKYLYSASLKNLYGFFPTSVYHGRSPNARGQLHIPSVPEVLRDIYFTIGHHIDGAVVDLTQKYISPDWRPDRQRNIAHPVGKVVWGDDMLAVDETASRLAGEETPNYIAPIRQLRKQILGK